MKQHSQPEYEIVPAGSGYYVVRVVNGYGEVIERFATQTAAEDFMGFLAHANAVAGLLADAAHHRWTRKLVA